MPLLSVFSTRPLTPSEAMVRAEACANTPVLAVEFREASPVERRAARGQRSRNLVARSGWRGSSRRRTVAPSGDRHDGQGHHGRAVLPHGCGDLGRSIPHRRPRVGRWRRTISTGVEALATRARPESLAPRRAGELMFPLAFQPLACHAARPARGPTRRGPAPASLRPFLDRAPRAGAGWLGVGGQSRAPCPPCPPRGGPSRVRLRGGGWTWPDAPPPQRRLRYRS